MTDDQGEKVVSGNHGHSDDSAVQSNIQEEIVCPLMEGQLLDSISKWIPDQERERFTPDGDTSIFCDQTKTLDNGVEVLLQARNSKKNKRNRNTSRYYYGKRIATPVRSPPD